MLDQIDWTRPWLAPLRRTGEAIAQAADWRHALNVAATEQGLKNHRGRAIHFVPQSDLPHAVAYETFISNTGAVPTRTNLHDFFNALAWLTFPKIKARLNELQAAEIERKTSPGLMGAEVVPHRGKLRDAATIFDENAALLIIRDQDLLSALREHRWTEAFIKHRAAFGVDCEVWLFGHALIEKLCAPYKAITAHTWVLEHNGDFFKLPAAHKTQWIDAAVAGRLSVEHNMADFTPLPVLGIPGWLDAQDETFYNDVAVFRPRRHSHR